MKKETKATHKIPSGMGGSFNVNIVGDLGNSFVVVINHKEAGDFHGKTQIVRKDTVEELK